MVDTARLLSGTDLAASIVADTAREASRFLREAGRQPCLVTVLVGDDPASATYVRMKQNRCRKAGIESRSLHLPESSSTPVVVDAVRDLSDDTSVDGILVQHPVPPTVDEHAAFEAIAPSKDVDGVTMHSFAAMALGHAGLVSCTPAGIMRLLAFHGVEVAGRHAVVIGRSPILGKPVGMLLLAADASVTFCHSRTLDLPSIVGTADLVVAAVGRPAFVPGDWLKPGVVVVDAGYNEGNIGDVAFDTAVEKASWITPVPGGVGPTTIAVLLEQTVEAAFRRRRAEG